RDDRGGEEVFPFAFAADPRRRAGGREVEDARFGVDRRRVPDRGATGLVGAVVRPGFAAGFARRGGGEEVPFFFAGFGVQRGQSTADAVLAAGAADVDLAVVIEGRTGDRET